MHDKRLWAKFNLNSDVLDSSLRCVTVTGSMLQTRKSVLDLSLLTSAQITSRMFSKRARLVHLCYILTHPLRRSTLVFLPAAAHFLKPKHVQVTFHFQLSD